MELEIRLIHDTKNQMYWYEEKIGDRWVEIPKTKAGCEGNATCNLEIYIKKKREERYKLYHEVVKEMKISLDF
jgi:hypothetical protein